MVRAVIPALVGALAAAAVGVLGFGVPALLGAPLLAAFAGIGGFVAAALAGGIAHIRGRPLAVRPLAGSAVAALAGAAWIALAPPAPGVTASEETLRALEALGYVVGDGEESIRGSSFWVPPLGERGGPSAETGVGRASDVHLRRGAAPG